VNRRSLLASGALVAALAALAVSSCSTFTANDQAARVGERSLAVEDIDALMANGQGRQHAATQDASLVRAELTRWIRVELVEQATGTTDTAVAGTADLDARLRNGNAALVAEMPDAGREMYQAGPSVSGTVCLGAIPVDPPEVAGTVLAELESGMSWADAAARYSADPGLAGNGGVVFDNQGSECVAIAVVNPDLIGPAVEAGVGHPVIVDVGTVTALVTIRPYDELSGAAQLVLAKTATNAIRWPELLASADVYVDPRYGVWNAVTAEVDPLQA
jgi:hypothetical protein